MKNSTADNLHSNTQNTVHNSANQSQMNTPDQTPINMNCYDAYEDQKPILSVLSNGSDAMASLNDVSKSNSLTPTPDNINWFLYRPRTRSAVRRLSLEDMIVISSDSEGSEVECTRNPFVMDIVPKEEKISDASTLEEAATARGLGTENSDFLIRKYSTESQEQQTNTTDGCVDAQQPTISPVKILKAVNASPLPKIRQDDHSDCSNDKKFSDSITDGTNQNIISSVGLSNKDDHSDEDKAVDGSNFVTEIVMKDENISDVPPLEEASVSHVVAIDKTEFLESGSCDEISVSSEKVLSAESTSPLAVMREDFHSDRKDSMEPIIISVDQNIDSTADSNNKDDYIEAVKDEFYDTSSTVPMVDESKSNDITEITAEVESISDVSVTDEAAHSPVIVNDIMESLESYEQHAPVTDNCVKIHQLTISSLTQLSAVNSGPLEEVRQDLQSNCSDDITEPITDGGTSQATQKVVSCAELSNDDENSEAVENNSCDIESSEAVVNCTDESMQIDSNETIEPNASSSHDIGSSTAVVNGIDESMQIDGRENIESNAGINESPELRVYGIGQTSRKHILCECNACKNVTSIGSEKDTTELVAETVSKLKPKCLQFESECESDSDDSIVPGKTPCEPPADITQNAVNQDCDSEDSPAQRLEWSSDQEELVVDLERANENRSNTSDSDENINEGEHSDRGNRSNDCENDQNADDSTCIGDTNQNLDDTEMSNVHNSSDDDDDELLNNSSQQNHYNGRSLSDDDIVTSGIYGQHVTNEAVNPPIIFPDSAVSRMNSMDEGTLQANDVPVSVLQTQDLSPAEEHAAASSVSSKSQNGDASMEEESNADNNEYDREHGQRPAEKDDKLLMRLKRRWSVGHCGSSKNLPKTPAKRKRIESSTESDSDGQPIRTNKRTHHKPIRMQNKTLLQVVERMEGFFRGMSKDLRDKQKKLKAKLSRKPKRLRKRQSAGADNFVVTPYREDKVVERMKEFVVVPDGQDIENEADV